jgi:hypothetical protein
VRPYFEQLFVVDNWQSRLISLEEKEFVVVLLIIN